MARTKMLKTLILIGLATLAFTGCSDDPAAPASNVIVDNAPPAIPANVTAAYDAGSVAVVWEANTVDTDLAGYLVEREHRGQTTVLTATPIMAVTYQDTNPQTGGNIYRVYAVDTSGNTSAVATSLVIITTSHQDGSDLSAE